MTMPATKHFLCGVLLLCALGAASPARAQLLMTLETLLDGSDVPVLAGGKPTGETMGIKPRLG